MMSNSSYGGIAFSVVPNGSFFPKVVLDQGVERYTCKVVFKTKAAHDGVLARLTILTEKRPIGVIAVNLHIDAGAGVAGLTIPSYGGTQETHQAVLVKMTDNEGYGREKVANFQASLEFIIV